MELLGWKGGGEGWSFCWMTLLCIVLFQKISIPLPQRVLLVSIPHPPGNSTFVSYFHILVFEIALPLEFSVTLLGVVWIFSGTAMILHVHVLSSLAKTGVQCWPDQQPAVGTVPFFFLMCTSLIFYLLCSVLIKLHQCVLALTDLMLSLRCCGNQPSLMPGTISSLARGLDVC